MNFMGRKKKKKIPIALLRVERGFAAKRNHINLRNATKHVLNTGVDYSNNPCSVFAVDLSAVCVGVERDSVFGAAAAGCRRDCPRELQSQTSVTLHSCRPSQQTQDCSDDGEEFSALDVTYRQTQVCEVCVCGGGEGWG